MAKAEEVVAALDRHDGVELLGLVLNERGYERFVASGLDRVNVTFGATESFNRANGNMSLAEAVTNAEAILTAAGEYPRSLTISVCFGCPFEGRVDPGVVVDLASRFAGRAEVVLADTIGVATPSAVRALVAQSGATGFHGHNTRNTGYANCLAALDAGAHVLDASIGGLGGCPFAPGASGNVCTEDLVHCLHAMGVETGVDLDALLAVSRRVQEIVGRVLPGQLVKAGKWDRRYPLPDGVRERIPARA